jgi:Cu+-exporting ATPase
MRVDEWSAEYAAEHEGERFIFCSDGCLRRFRDSPERYLTDLAGD